TSRFKLESLLIKKDEDLAIPKELQGAMECGVCLNLCERPVQLSCGHTFCESCVHQLVAMRPDQGGANQQVDWIPRFVLQDEDEQEVRLGNNDRGGGMPQLHLMDPRMQGGGNGGGMNVIGAPPQHAAQQQMEHHRVMMGMMGMAGQPAVPAPRMGMGGYMMHPMAPIGMGHMNVNMNPPAGAIQGRQQIQRAPMRMDANQPAYLQGIRMGPVQQPMGNQPRYGGYGGRTETVNCPECRSPTTIPPNGLPVNYKVQDLIERVKARSKVIEPVGCICQSCRTPINCPFYFSCTNEECKESAAVICSMCGLRNHNGHNVRENHVLSSEKVNAEKEKIRAMQMDAVALKSQFFEHRDRILEQTDHVQDVLSEALKEFEMLSLELDRSEPFTQRDVDLRVAKARKLTHAFEKLVLRMKLTKNTVIETVANEMDGLMGRVEEICKMDRLDEEEESPREREGAEGEEAQEGTELYRINEISAQMTAKLNAFKIRKSTSLQKKRDENKKLKSMREEKKDEMEERRSSGGRRATGVSRRDMREIKQEPVDQYEMFTNMNDINLRDENGETRGAPSGFSHTLLKRRRLSPSPAGCSSRRERRRGEEEACSSRSLNHAALPFPPVPQLGETDEREMGAIAIEGAVDGLLNNEDVLDILDDGRIIRQEDIEGIADDGRFMVRPGGVIHVMPDGEEDEVEY
ncbi:hypothetical protein PMAYCL1PPCAC_29525, partial [Pristionchus mayeri]